MSEFKVEHVGTADSDDWMMRECRVEVIRTDDFGPQVPMVWTVRVRHVPSGRWVVRSGIGPFEQSAVIDELVAQLAGDAGVRPYQR